MRWTGMLYNVRQEKNTRRMNDIGCLYLDVKKQNKKQNSTWSKKKEKKETQSEKKQSEGNDGKRKEEANDIR